MHFQRVALTGHFFHPLDFTGDSMGFYYDESEQQMILYTPSSNYPSDDPYNWNSRMRFERK